MLPSYNLLSFYAQQFCSVPFCCSLEKYFSQLIIYISWIVSKVLSKEMIVEHFSSKIFLSFKYFSPSKCKNMFLRSEREMEKVITLSITSTSDTYLLTLHSNTQTFSIMNIIKIEGNFQLINFINFHLCYWKYLLKIIN